jgi:hypothetical protein
MLGTVCLEVPVALWHILPLFTLGENAFLIFEKSLFKARSNSIS